MKGLKYMNVLFRRGDQTFIDNNVPLNDGQIIFNETDEAIYVDNTINGTVVRKRYGGGNLSRSDIDMAFSTTSENPIANKVVTNAIGTLSNLTTDAKTNLVGAINEVDAHADTAQSTANTANSKANIVQAQVSNSGDAYDSTKAYAVGDLCIYNNVLYRCTTACSAGSWATNQSCFTQDTLVNFLNNDFSKIKSYKRVTINGTLDGNRDFGVSLSAIAQNGNIASNRIKIVIPEGVQPLTTWECKPSGIFYNNSSSLWTTHNLSNISDNVRMNFIVLYTI